MQALSAQSVRVGTRHFLLVSDLFSLFLSFFLSHQLLPYYRQYIVSGPFLFEPLGVHLWLLLLILPLWYVLLSRAGLYSGARIPWRIALWKTIRVQIVGLAALSFLLFALKLQAVSRLIVFGFAALYVPVSLACRWLTLSVLEARRSHIYNIPRILVIGTKERAKEFIRRTKNLEEIRCEVVGCLEPEAPLAQGTVEGVPILGTTEILPRYLFHHPVDIVILAMPPEQIPNARELVEAAMELGLRTFIIPELYLHRLGFRLDSPEASLESLFGLPAPVLSNVRQKAHYLLFKGAIDIIVSATLLVLLAPVFALIAVLIKCTSPSGPVFYRWRVLGTNKKPFVGYKFRTMVPNAEELKSTLIAHNQMQGPVFKMKNDPRVTPLGRFLRKFSLDELPQLYSVLKGDMSLVGPRPPGKEEADRFEFWQRRKLSVKPGITCLWQVNGRNEITDFEEWVRLDVEYIKSASLWMDFKILLKTIPAVLRGRGAY
jgi:exopolysaccharide biosynthesis polyprenyl glycosylphosphotransferase